MEATKTLILALVVLTAAITATADGGNICGVSEEELLECQPAVATGAAAPPQPSAACCAALAHTNLTCFCTFKDNTFLPLLGINATRAIQLPSICDPTQNAHC